MEADDARANAFDKKGRRPQLTDGWAVCRELEDQPEGEQGQADVRAYLGHQRPDDGPGGRSTSSLNDIMYIIGQLDMHARHHRLAPTGRFISMSSPDATVSDTLRALEALADPKILAVNERHGDDHAVNLTKLRAVAKDLKKNQELALKLWDSGDTAARLVSLLICRPKEFSTDQLDSMIREARTPKVTDWLINYVVKKHPHWDELRRLWLADPDDAVRAAGWSLNTFAITAAPSRIDPDSLLKSIESDMDGAPPRLQWNMNETLANIGIEHPDLRQRAIDIGERLGVLRDYPTPPNCTSPFAPIWIEEIVRRREPK